jgi:putative hydrolase of the HAD superfamily
VLVLFDIDDTLIDHTSSVHVGVSRVHEAFGVQGDLGAFLSSWRHAHERHYPSFLSGAMTLQATRRARVRDVLGYHLADSEADSVFDLYFAAYEASWSLFEDVPACIERLAYCRLGIISNGPGDEQRRKLVRTGIAERFEVVVVSEECGVAKPSRGIFQHACALLRELPSNCAYVGDRVDLDAEAASAAGLRGIWLDRHNTGASRYVGPRIESLSGLAELIEGAECCPTTVAADERLAALGVHS